MHGVHVFLTIGAFPTNFSKRDRSLTKSLLLKNNNLIMTVTQQYIPNPDAIENTQKHNRLTRSNLRMMPTMLLLYILKQAYSSDKSSLLLSRLLECHYTAQARVMSFEQSHHNTRYY